MQKKEDSPESFKGKYEQANFLTRPIIDNFFRTVREVIPDDAMHILEAGCGAGYSSQILKKMLPGRSYEASELESTLVEFARKLNPDIPVQAESLYALERPPESVDLIICLEVLEHLDDPEKALQEMARVSSQYVVLSVPNEPLWRFLNALRGKYLRYFGNTPGHINHWSSFSFAKFVGKYFEVVEVRTPTPWTVVLAKKK